MKCHYCNTDVPDRAQYCPNCGIAVESDDTVQNNTCQRGRYTHKSKRKDNSQSYQKKWYLSAPVLIASAIFCFPLALALSVLRLKDLRRQDRSYQISGLTTVFGSLAVFSLLIIIGVASSKWESDFRDAISQKDYARAHSILDDHFQSDISAYSIDCYFDLYSAFGDYNGAEIILEQYYNGLPDKTEFEDSVAQKYNQSSYFFTDEQEQRIAKILADVNSAKQQKKELEAQKKTQKKTQKDNKPTVTQPTNIVEQTESSSEESTAAPQDILANYRKAKDVIDKYFENSSDKNLKAVKKQDKTAALGYLVEKAQGIASNAQARRNNPSSIYKELQSIQALRSDAFGEVPIQIQNACAIAKSITELTEKRDLISRKYPFAISKAYQLSQNDYYVYQRLEQKYADNIIGSIQKEVASYSTSNASDWVAYNVEYSILGATPGDNCFVIHSDQKNPFPKQGSYTLLCYDSGKTQSLIDSKGFSFDAPVLYMVANAEKLYSDYDEYTNLQTEISSLGAQLEGVFGLTSSEETTTEPNMTESPNVVQIPQQSGSTAPEPRIAYVVNAEGGLNVRSGPHTSDAQVDRLPVGKQVTIIEVQTVDGRQWGRINSGWVCMDYISYDLPSGTCYMEDVPEDVLLRYEGKWEDRVGQRCSVEIWYGLTAFSIEMRWGSSASQSTEWSFTGIYDDNSDSLTYTNGKCVERTYYDGGGMSESIRYTNGSGRFYISGGEMYWEDYSEGVGSRCIFEKIQ